MQPQFVLPPALSALAAYRQFIVYQAVPSATRPGKTDKFPIDYRTGRKGDAHDPALWLTWQEAAGYAEAFGPDYGVGFVFTREAGLFFIDLDNCLKDPTRRELGWNDTALALFARFNGASVEVSHSGCGLHIIGHAQAPAHSCRNAEHNVELYTEARFVALTGLNAVGDAGTDHTAALAAVAAEYFPPKVAGEVVGWNDGPCTGWQGPADDAELIRRALKSRSASGVFGGKAAFADLWENNVPALTAAFPDPSRDYDASRADAALAQHLAFWTGKDCERIARLMLQSQLVREKWNRPDYLQRTIEAVVSRQVDVLHDQALALPAVAPQPSAPITTNRWVFDLYNPVADASLPPITYRDDRKLWPDSPGKTVTQIIADPKCHKTNWIMAEHFRLMRKGARVLVLALEGTYGVRRNRLPALAMHYGVPLPDLNGRFQVVDIKEGGMFDLSNGACVDAFSEWLKLQGWTDVIIDTQHRASGSLEENSATDARQLWNAVEKIRTVNKVNVTLAHHKGKDLSKGGRGSSADLASVDQQIELIFDRNAMTVTAKVTARKDGVDGFSVPFKVHQPMPDAVPILLPISDEEFKEVTAARDPIAPEVISTALRELGCISGKKCSSKELATKILTVPNCTPTNEAVTKLANQLTKSVNKSGSKISAYASKSGSMRQSSWLWTLPDIELAAG